MSLSRPRLTRALFALVALSLLVGSCGREITGPAGARRAVVALNPQFAALRLDGSGEVLSVGSIVPFTRVRVVLLRANGDTAVNRVVDFPADADSISLTFPFRAPLPGRARRGGPRRRAGGGDDRRRQERLVVPRPRHAARRRPERRHPQVP